MLNMLDIISTFSIHSSQSRSTRKQTGNVSKGSTARQSTRPGQKFHKLPIQDQLFKNSPKNEKLNELMIIEDNLNEEIFLESNIFPLLIFQQISYRQLLKEIKFEKGILSLHPEDKRNYILYRIMCELFSELQFGIQNILICQHPITKIFFIYFSDTEYCPISRCCKQNITVKIGEVIGGQIICLNQKCPLKILTTFEVEEKILWKRKQPKIDSISNLITSGKYRTKSLLQSIPQVTTTRKIQQQTTNLWKRTTTFHQKASQTNYEQMYKYQLSKNILLNSQIFNKDFAGSFDEKII